MDNRKYVLKKDGNKSHLMKVALLELRGAAFTNLKHTHAHTHTHISNILSKYFELHAEETKEQVLFNKSFFSACCCCFY